MELQRVSVLLVLVLVQPNALPTDMPESYLENADEWLVEIVDTIGEVESDTSIGLSSSGTPNIAYIESSGYLVLSSRKGVIWTKTSVDGPGSSTSVSLALNEIDEPRIAYNFNQTLRYAASNNSLWDIEVVSVKDASGISLRADSSDTPHISFSIGSTAYYVTFQGVAWLLELIEMGMGMGTHTSLGLDSSGIPHVAYSPDSLTYANRTEGSWVVDNPMGEGAQPASVSLSFDPQYRLFLAYVDLPPTGLKYMEKSDGGWEWEYVDKDPGAGLQTSLAFSPSGNAQIAYYDSHDKDLRYACRLGSEWTVKIVDSEGKAGLHPSLAVDSLGRPHISYRKDDKVMYARGPPCESNVPPHADAGSDQTTDEGDVVQYDGTGSYDPDNTLGWRDSVPVPTARRGAVIVPVNGRIYVIGGGVWNDNQTSIRATNITEEYDPETGVWTTKSSMPTAREIMGGAVVDGKIYVVGGLDYSKPHPFGMFNITEVYDPLTDTWETRAPMPGASYSTATSAGGKVYAFVDLPGEFLEYDPTSDSWAELPYIPGDQILQVRLIGYEGLVYSFGGARKGAVSDAYVFDPESSTWANLTPMTTARFTVGLTSLGDRIIVAGGEVGNDFELTDVVEEYNITSDSWETVAPMSIERDELGLATVNGRVFALAGKNWYLGGPLNHNEEYSHFLLYDWDFGDGSPHSSEVSPVHTYNQSGEYTVTLEVTDPGGAVGVDTCIVTVRSIENPPVADAGPDQTASEGDVVQFDGTGSYDPDSGAEGWKNVSNIPTTRFRVAGAVLDNELYVIGGWELPGWNDTGTVEKYDPATDSWSSVAPIYMPHADMAAGAAGGNLYAFGGYAGNESQITNLEYNPATNMWANRTPMPFARHNHAVAVVNEKIYVIGGSNSMIDCPTLNLVDEYDPATDTWTPKAVMPTYREGLTATVHEGKIYAIGGHAYCPGDSFVSQKTVEVYDPATDTWTSAQSIPTGRTEMQAEVLNGKIFAMGGTNWTMERPPEFKPAWSTVEVYDPTTGSWSPAQQMLETRSQFTSGMVSGRIYVAAGHSAGWIWEVPPPEWSEEYGPGGEELEYEWDFDASIDLNGDGNFTNDAEATGPMPTHIYYDDGVYVATLTVTDKSGLSDSDNCTITVLNVAPTPEWTSRSSDGMILNPPYPEGREILFEATVDDPGTYDTFTYDWDFGDGTILLDAGPSVTHTYGDNDLHIVVLTVTDDDGGVGIDNTPPLETTNENPVASISMPFCIFTEGTDPCAPVGEFTDPGWLDTHAAVWNFGDGTYETAILTEENDPPDATGWNITSHIYGDNGAYTISFTVTDDDGGVGSASAEAQVMNLPPTLDMNAPSTVNEGEDFVVEITATDQGSDDITLTVDWGDGTSETVTYYNDGVGPDPPNSGEGIWPFIVTASLTHVYGDNGNFSIQVTAADDDGDSVQELTVVEVLNLPPEIMLLAVPLSVHEGEEFSIIAEATDPGSDDIEFSWTFELGPSMSTMHYNDGVGLDLPLSPWGIFPFVAEDTVNHTYGDNGYYNVSITATDDDGGMSTMTFTIEVTNVAPFVDIGGPYWGDENSAIEFTATAVDPGSDDLTFIWDWGDGTTEAIAFYNDGVSDDPSKSPWGTYPFEATHATSHLWGDNGDFIVTLTVTDDDGGVTVEQTVATVNNVAPTIGGISYYLNASFAFRIAGEKWHNVEIYLYEDGTEVGYASITRYPGSPNEQMADLGEFSIDFSKTYSAVAYYTPEDDPVNGQIWGATPAWVILEYEDGEERIHHTFNVRHEDTWTWVIDDFSPYFLGHNITFMATASDPGSDDLTFTWNWGDGTITESTYFNDGVGPDPYPSPEVNPITVTDTAKHAYASAGTYTITLTVIDDDGGVTSYSLNLAL